MTTKVGTVQPLSHRWHPTHRVVGRVLNVSSIGPTGSERCLHCFARRWARPEHYSPSCGGSIEHDARIANACPKAPA